MARPSGRIFQNIRADFLEISEIVEFPHFPDFQNFRNFQSFQNFGNFGNFGNRKVRGENFGNFGIEFGKADRHPSDDRPCTTTQLRAHGLSTGEGDHTYIYIYICI